jgi:hypothetical protein
MMGIAIEGSDKWWPGEKSKALLPVFDSYNRQSHYIDVFNRGSESFHFSVKAEEPWIVISKNENTVDTEQRIWISIDWTSAPRDTQVTPIIFSGPDSSTLTVSAVSFNPASPDRAGENGFIESNGYISIEAPHFSESVADGPTKWQIIPDLGRTLAAVTPLPVRKSYKDIDKTNPHLEYGIYLFFTGTFKLKTILSPTLNFHNNQGLRFAVSIDEEKPEIINIHKDRTFQDWEESVRTNSIVAESIHQVKSPGKHILKIWMIDPGIVIQKLILETRKMAPSYLGPPESYNSVFISN